jgi:hypothetical protein
MEAVVQVVFDQKTEKIFAFKAAKHVRMDRYSSQARPLKAQTLPRKAVPFRTTRYL